MFDNTENWLALIPSTMICPSIPRSMKALVRNIVNQIMFVIIKMVILLLTIRVPTDQSNINIINIANQKGKVKAWYCQLRNITKCFQSNAVAEIFLLIESHWLGLVVFRLHSQEDAQICKKMITIISQETGSDKTKGYAISRRVKTNLICPFEYRK